MDASQRTRMINQAANIYLARTKSVDSSLLTFNRLQRASYAGAAKLHTSTYYKGDPTLNPVIYDGKTCPQDHSYTNGYTNATYLSQHETVANTRAGAAICGDADYSTAPPGIILLTPSMRSTILTSYNNNTPMVSIPPPVIPQILVPTLGPFNSMAFEGNSFVHLSTDSRFDQGPLLENALYNGSSDFTIEYFIQLKTPSNQTEPQNIFYIGNDTGVDTYRMIGQILYVSPGKYTFSLQVSTYPIVTFGDFQLGKWYHMAIVRSGTTINSYLNGTKLSNLFISENIPATGGPTNYTTYLNSVAILGASYDTGATPLFNYGFTGYLSNFRWTKGTAIYTSSNFPIPSVAFSDFNMQGVYWSLNPYYAVLLLSSSDSDLLLNSGNPQTGPNPISVSITDGSIFSTSDPPIAYNPVTWELV